jgi:hypothetical protein
MQRVLVGKWSTSLGDTVCTMPVQQYGRVFWSRRSGVRLWAGCTVEGCRYSASCGCPWLPFLVLVCKCWPGCDEFSHVLTMLWFVRQLKDLPADVSVTTANHLQSHMLEVAWSRQVQRCLSGPTEASSSVPVFDRLLNCICASLRALSKLPILITRYPRFSLRAALDLNAYYIAHSCFPFLWLAGLIGRVVSFVAIVVAIIVVQVHSSVACRSPFVCVWAGCRGASRGGAKCSPSGEHT